MKIAVNGKALNLPRMCACCGGANPETSYEVSDFQQRGRT